MTQRVFTVGHSNSTLDALCALLVTHAVQTAIDIRTVARSAKWPEFNEDFIRARLQKLGKKYLSRGPALGGHPSDHKFYLSDGRVNFQMLEDVPAFAAELEKLVSGAYGPTPALLCSEGDPLDCNRFFSSGRLLHARGVEVLHILQDGSILTQTEGEMRMRIETGYDQPSLFETPEARLESAYAELRRRYKHRWGK